MRNNSLHDESLRLPICTNHIFIGALMFNARDNDEALSLGITREREKKLILQILTTSNVDKKL